MRHVIHLTLHHTKSNAASKRADLGGYSSQSLHIPPSTDVGLQRLSTAASFHRQDGEAAQ
jgi:hypothetical protein